VTEEVGMGMLLGGMQSHGGDMDGKTAVIDALTKTILYFFFWWNLRTCIISTTYQPLKIY
jgi:hypothetical protein